VEEDTPTAASLPINITELVMLFLQVQVVQPVAFVTLELVVAFVHTNLQTVHHVPAACNANQKCAHNTTINRTFVTHALVITQKHRTLME